ncbi:MAG: ornithine cyclodeaminase family protein [Planctomycetota bacterium]
MELRAFSSADIRAAVPMARAIEAIKDVYVQVSSGQAVVPLRLALPVEKHSGVTLVMPAYLSGSGGLGAKLVSVFPGNRELGLATTNALVVLVDDRTGVPKAILEGTSLTALRTGAAAGAATDALARRDARVLALIGAGVQARTQLEGVAAVRAIREVRVYDTDRGRADAFSAELRRRGVPGQPEIEAAPSPGAATAGADVVSTATTSDRPVFRDADIRPGTHINAMGSFQPEVQEVPEETVARAKVVVDSREAALAEAGDLIVPLRRGTIGPAHIHAELGEVLSGRAAGRVSDAEVTLFESVGLAAQDLAVAAIVLAEADRLGLGTPIEL